MGRTRALPVLVPSVSNQRWSCHSCGDCCRTLVVHLNEEDRDRLDDQDWSDTLDVPPYIRAGRGYVLNHKTTGGCVFLDEDNRCLVHARYGANAKPHACRLFPFSLRPTALGWQASLRFDCPSVSASDGVPLTQHRAELGELVEGVARTAPRSVDATRLQPRIAATSEETQAVTAHYVRWMRRQEHTLTHRLIGAAHVTAMLQQATLRNVRGERFTELLDLLFGALPAERSNPLDTATRRQRGMLRQSVFAHSEHVSLRQLRSGPLPKLGLRWRQFGYAHRFLRGRGAVPPIAGLTSSDVSFRAVDAVACAADDTPISDLLARYVSVRLESRSVFGEGYYGWTVVSGLAALFLSIAVVGWLSRYLAAAAKREQIGLEDAKHALAIVDRAATRLPALGTAAERARVRYLSEDDGIARLVNDYAMVGEAK